MPTATSCAKALPVEPAEYRTVTLPLRDGIALTKAAWADLDSFPLSTLEPYRSIVTRRSPTESRPPSIYQLVWQGRYYQLWHRPAQPETTILEHVPLGESLQLPYCGRPRTGPTSRSARSTRWRTPPCSQIEALGRQALREQRTLVAYQRPAPIVARGDQTLWPRRVAARSRRTQPRRRPPRARATATSRWPAPNRMNCGSPGASPAALK